MDHAKELAVPTAAAPRARRRLAFLSALMTLAATALCALPGRGANVLLVIQNSTISSSENSRKTQFQTWGHTVTTIVDSSTQTSFNTAMAAVDVVYIPVTVDDWEITNKCKNTTKGVVCEERYIDDDMGFSTGSGWDASHTQTEILNNTHAITTGLSTGYVTIVSSSQQLSMMNPTVSSGLTALSKQNYSAGNMLGVIDVGGALAGGGTAAGRRVRLPWGGDSFTWSALNASGLKICQQAISWAGGSSGSLVGHWKLNETSGTTAVDSSSKGNNGTYQGNVALNQSGPYPGKGSVAASFDGSGDYVQIPNESDYDITSAITVAAWFKVSTFDEGFQALVTKGDNAWRISRDNNTNYLHFACDGTSHASLYGNIAVNDGKWHHVVGVYDGSAIKLYVDGVLDVSASSTGSIATNNQPVMLGRNADHDWRDWNGGLHDVRIYSYALSDVEIARLYGLIAHWKLDESSGSTADDASLANNDATRTGTSAWTAAFDNNGHNFVYTDGEDYFTAPSNSDLDDVQDDDYTVMAYFKPNSVPSGSGSANNSAYGIIRKTGWHAGLAYGNDGSFYMEHWLNSGPTWVGAGDWAYHAPNQFYHVAGVVSKTDGTVKIYVDGELKETTTYTAGTAAWDYTTNRWRLGISSPGASTWGHASDGVIDDARIYNRALSDAEIAAIAKTGLRAHWKFDESSGTALADSSGQSNSAAFASGTPTHVSAVRDYGLAFNGANSADTDANFDPPPQGSVAFWLKPTAVPSSTNRLFGTSDAWETRLESTGLLTCDIGVGGGITSNSTFTSTVKWRHVVFNYNSIADTYEMYVDGVLEKSGGLTGSDQPAGILTFGTRTGSTNYYNGSLDDVRVYGRPLSAAEIAEIYGLIGHWKFDEGSGSTLADSSGKGNNATFNTGTPAWVAGVRGKCLQFDGTNDAITGTAFTPPTEGAVAFWYRCNGPSGIQRLFGLGGNWETRLYSDGVLYFDVNADSPGGANSMNTLTPMATSGQWYHAVLTFDSDDDTYAIYINGELHKSGVSGNDLTQQTAAQLSFGNRTGTTERLIGALDDVRIYNRKLSQQEIYEIYGLAAWYKLDETSGTFAADATGLGNDGAYVGSPTLGAASNGGPGMGTAVDFSGSNYLQTSSLGPKTTSVSVAGWARLDAKDSGGAELVSIGDYFRLRLDNGGTTARTSYYNGTTWVDLDYPITLAGAGWHHFAATLNAGDALKLYINGNEVATASAPGTINYSGQGTTTRIGSHGNTNTTFDFDGRIDDVRIYDRAMTPEEVFALYRGSRINGVKILRWVETR